MNFTEFKQKYEKEPVGILNENAHSKPLVSVCIQTFNQVHYIESCLDGVLLQKTSFPIEILLGDDGSEDGTRQICLQYAKKYPDKIRLFLHSRKNNIKVEGRPSANFNALYNLFSAKGKYIAVCEGDDFWTEPYKLQKQFEFMESHLQYSICYHDFKTINSFGEVIGTDKASPLRKDLEANELLVPFIHPATLTIFFRNIIHKNIPIEMTKVINPDVFLYTLLGQKGLGKYLKQIQPAFYRAHEAGIWSEVKMDSKLLSMINTYHQISLYYTKAEKKEIASLFDSRIKKLKRYMLYLSIKNMQPIKFFKLIPFYLN